MDIDKLEAGREIDERIAQEALGWRLCQDYRGSQALGTYYWRDEKGNRRGPEGDCRGFFSTTVKGANELLDSWPYDYLIRRQDGRFKCVLFVPLEAVVAWADTFELAVSRARLKAAMAVESAAQTGEEV